MAREGAALVGWLGLAGFIAASPGASAQPSTSQVPPPPDATAGAQAASSADAAAVGAQASRQPTDYFSPRPPTELPQELEDAKTGYTNWLRLDASDDPLEGLQTLTSDLQTRTGLKLGMAYTMLFQQASGGPGDRSAAAGDVDLLASWKFGSPDSADYWRINFSAEYRHQIGDITPADLGPEIGTLVPTTNGFGERPLVVKELYYEQRAFDGALRAVIGRIDSENFVGGHRLQSQNTYFLNKAFSGNPAIALPSIGLGAGLAVLPTKWFYILGGVTDANAKITRTGFDTAFDTGEVFLFAETGLLRDPGGANPGRARLSVWHVDEREEAGRPSDAGVSVSIDQEFGERVIAFARAAYADADVTGLRYLVEGGVALEGVVGSSSDVTGLAVAWAAPPEGREETIAEVFHRFQVAPRVQFTLGGQLILNPGNAPEDDALGVFSVRLRFSF